MGALRDLRRGCGLLASRLQLKTAFSELLPSNDPGVVTLTRTQKRMGDMSLLLIGVRSPDYAANLRYAEALTQKLRALPPTVVNLATYDVRDLRAFYQQNKWLFVSEDDLESIRDRLRNEISKRKNPLFVSLDDEEPIDKMQSRIERHDGLDERFPGGVFTSNNGEYVWIAALPAGRPLRRARGGGAVRRRQRADQERSALALPPPDDGPGGGAHRHRDRQPRRPSSTTSSWSPPSAWSS